MDYSHFLTPTLGIGGIVLLAVLMLLRGDIVPRKQVDAMMDAKNEQIDFYKRAYDDLLSAQQGRDQQIAALMETARTTRQVIAALPEAAGLTEGGSHVPAPETD